MELEIDRREKHESYGVVRFSRCSGQPRLFKSDIQGGNFITLEISSAIVDHHLSRDWVHEDKKLIEVYLSPSQFSELLTTMNYGSGVPCTIRYLNGRATDTIPNRDSEEKIISDNFKSKMSELSKKMKSDVTDIENLLNSGKTLNKKDKEDLLWKYKKIVQEVESNMPFVLDQFQESVEKTVIQAKAEIEAQINNVIHRTGLDSLKSLKVPVLEIEKQ